MTIQHALASTNLLTADELDIHLSIGIDYGKILIVNNRDIFGDAVNRACKLGEDIAAAGEVLATKEAMDLIPKEAEIQGRPIEVSIGGMSVPSFVIIQGADAEKREL